MRRALILGVALAGALGCSDALTPIQDAGSSSGADVADVGEMDADTELGDSGGTDGTPDVLTDAASDAGSDTGDDVATDAAADAASDTADGDAGIDVGDATVEVVGLAEAEAAYATYCALCHGDDGDGYAADAATALTNQSWLTTADDDFIRNAIANGRPGTPMSAWADSRGGPLTNVEIEALVKLIRGWQTELTVNLPEGAVTGSAERAEPLYEFHCMECHGADGAGKPYLNLSNPELLANASDAFLRYAVAKGRPGTPMPAYETTLTTQGIDDLVVLIRSWQVDPSAPPEVFPNDEAPAVMNPDGPEPDLADTHYVSVDTVHAAWQAGAKMVLVDARPGSDYVVEHIDGAISIPFYAVADHLGRLPEDTWIVSYCACPHAESDLVADALAAAGFDKLRVIDEGFLEWKAKGYPMDSGADP